MGARRRWMMVGAALVLLAASAALAWRLTRGAPAPSPPPIDLTGVEPAVAATVDQALAAVRREPRSGVAWGRLGKVLHANGFSAEAEACYAHAERFEPAEPRWPYLRGTRVVLRDREAALPLLRRAVELADRADPTNPTPRLLLAEVLLELGDHDEARELCERALEREPDNPRAHFTLGVLALARDDLRASIAHLTRAAESPFTRKRALAQLAGASRRSGNATAALAFTRRAEKAPGDVPMIDPYLGEVNRLRAGRQGRFLEAERLEGEGRLQESAQVLRSLVDDLPDDRTQLALGVCLSKLGDNAGAEKVFREALKQAPEKATIHYALSVALYRQGEARERAGGAAAARAAFEEAAAAALRATQLKPDHALAFTFRGQALVRLGRAREALVCLRDAVRARPDLADPHLRLGEALVAGGQREEGLKHLRLAVELASPGDPRPRQALGRASAGGKGP